MSFLGFGRHAPDLSAVLEAPMPPRIEPEPVALAPEPEPEPEPEIVPFGAKFGRLTQFGEVWVDLDQVDSIDFDPEDGCAVEVTLRSGECVHLSDEAGDALEKYMQSFAAIQS